MNLQLSEINFLIFIIPGFVVVWTFRFFTGNKKQGEFEYVGLSFVWGLVLYILVWYLSTHVLKGLKGIYQDEYGYGLAAVLCTFGFILGWCGSILASWDWFNKVVNEFRPKKFKK